MQSTLTFPVAYEPASEISLGSGALTLMMYRSTPRSGQRRVEYRIEGLSTTWGCVGVGRRARVWVWVWVWVRGKGWAKELVFMNDVMTP